MVRLLSLLPFGRETFTLKLFKPIIKPEIWLKATVVELFGSKFPIQFKVWVLTPFALKVNNALFKAEHKSHYSKQDVDILDDYRTVVPVGMMKLVYDKV